jgi:cytochrome b involved in lipid metabolism
MLPLFIDSNYHSLHHEYGKGNYAFFFPFWDDYMKTRVTELPLKKIESLDEMTIEEFNNQCKNGKKYTIIRKKIIDCELWITKHPGGAIFIERLIGKDSTEDYEKMHKNSSSANDMLEKLKIATLATTR